MQRAAAPIPKSSNEHRVVIPIESRDEAVVAHSGGLPIYNPAAKKEQQRLQYANEEKLIHSIPVILILCFFILWCFSHPVDLASKNGIVIEGAQQTEATLPVRLGHSFVDIAALRPFFMLKSASVENQELVDRNGDTPHA